MGFFVALQFLTTIPSPFRRALAAELNASAVDHFTLVGLLLGLIVAGLDALLGVVFPPSLVGALVIVSLVLLTGALHLDGFMDTCDGIFNRSSPERRLEIMRDSRVGAFGVVGLASLFLVKYAALVSLPMQVQPAGLVLMATTSRLAISYAVVCFPYGRPFGLGTPFQGGRRAFALGLNTLFVVTLAYFLFGLLGIGALLAVAVSVWLGALYIRTKIPGLTGDTYGALSEFSEVLVLLVLVVGR
ncbi:MAG: adenosylcobinamide-GDP ribazoletransferase [Chloroflexi bacterium]|nr:adenosylcobinamide-GDP ribazoletransferase [Chloroflexota bacterium]